MAKQVVLTFGEEEIQELERIDLDSDAPGAWASFGRLWGKS